MTTSRWKQVQHLGFRVFKVREPEQQVQTAVRALSTLLPGGVAAEVHVDTYGSDQVAETPALPLPGLFPPALESSSDAQHHRERPHARTGCCRPD